MITPGGLGLPSRELYLGEAQAQRDVRQAYLDYLKDLLAKVGRRANVRSNGPHILRHTFCSHLAMKGAPARAIQELAGHRDLATTQRYMHLSPSAVIDAIRLLEGAQKFGDILETGDPEKLSR